MRILTYTTLFPNSTNHEYGIFIYQRASRVQARRGNEVVAVSPVPFVPRWLKGNRWRAHSHVPKEERIGDIAVHHPRYFLLPKIWMPFHALTMFLGSLRLVQRLHREREFDVIDAHFVYPDGLAAVLLGWVMRIPVVVSARGTDINLFPTFRLIRPLIRKTLKMADGLIAVSAALKEKMVALGTEPEKIRLITNGVDPTTFRFVGQEEARNQLGLPAGVPIIVSVGALVPLKNHKTLIRAFRKLGLTHPSAQLFILGEGPCRPGLEHLVKEMGLSKRVQLPGQRPNAELALWFNAADFSCLASQREGWPNVVTESLACGTPVVATRVGGIPEVLHSPHLGMMSEQSVESLAKGMEEALNRSWDREEISRETRTRTWEIVAEEVEAVLQGQSQSR